MSVRPVVMRTLFGAAVALGGLLALVVLTAILVIATGTARFYVVPSSAMEPTLHCAEPDPGCEADRRDRFAVLTRLVSYDRGDIVVFETPPAAAERCGAGGTSVKRIVGLPGERIETRVERGAAYVYVDGERLDEPYVEQDRRDIGPEDRFRVPEDHFFVLGDNRAQSCDSRIFGPVPAGNVVGEVVVTYWPPGRISVG